MAYAFVEDIAEQQVQFKLTEGHPRVLVTPASLETLRRRARTTHQAQMQSLRELAEKELPEAKALPGTIFRLAFLYLLSEEPGHARKCAEAVEKLIALPVTGEYFPGPARLKALACAYDWVHAAIGQELLPRLGRRVLEYCQALYDSREIEPGNFFLGHNINQIPYVLMGGVAVGDEIEGGRKYIANILWRWEKTWPGYKHFLEGECFQMSYSYTCTYVAELPYLFQVMETGLGLPAFERWPWMAGAVKWWTYAFRSDQTFVRFGDYFCGYPVLKNAAYYRPLANAASRYRDGLAQWWVNRFDLTGAEPDQFLFEDRDNSPAEIDPNSLPRSRHFEPMGVVSVRGDFADGTLATFKCTPHYLHNHCHRDANSFTLWHKGDLAIDSGAYVGYDAHPHWYNYYVRSIAHNTIVIHDPDEVFNSRGKVYSNDGGQRFVNQPDFQPRIYTDLEKPEFRDGRITAYVEGQGWTYACGDASNCYSKQKLSKFVRHAVYLLDWPRKSAVSLVILDEVELVKDLTPRFLLHTREEPRLLGRQALVRQGGGRLTLTVLQPQPAKMELIGGEGKEFWVDGRNYPLNAPERGPMNPGNWRLEVSPPSPARKTTFLTMLVPADIDWEAEPIPTAEAIPGGYVIRQGQLAVVLSRQPNAVTAERLVSVTLAGEGQ